MGNIRDFFKKIRNIKGTFHSRMSTIKNRNCKDLRDTDVWSGLLDSEGEEEGGMIWENGIETCILSCKKQITSLCPMQDTICLGLVHGDDPERCYGEGGGRGVHVWEHMYTRGGFMSMYGKTKTVL